jgi:hypothetical protein
MVWKRLQLGLKDYQAIISSLKELSTELQTCSCPSIGEYFNNTSGSGSFIIPEGVNVIRILLSGGGGLLDTILQVKESDKISYTIGGGHGDFGLGGAGGGLLDTIL